MPVFHDLRALFVHIPKNAGRSIEKALLGSSGTPDQGRRNLANRVATLAQRKSADRFASEFLIGTIDYSLTAQHLTYLEMEHLRIVPPEILHDYTTFCVCRNPYDRTVSTVMHFSESIASAECNSPPASPTEFERQLSAWFDYDKQDHNLISHDRSQSDFVLNARGELAVQKILRFERLADDFSVFAEQLGLPSGALTWFGKAERSRRYQDYYTPQSRRLVEKRFGEDLELFQYQYEEKAG